MIDAFDNRREDKADLMFSRLWHAGRSRRQEVMGGGAGRAGRLPGLLG